ncbi:MAG: DUF2442 domain-containing protein [Elusimicrobia bacterium]|jgi:hypothetical protein|nr:DUF2442 domain-containing protein [Elusimicrobiota bacterium]
MSISANKKVMESVAVDVWFSKNKLSLRLSDGRELAVPIDWFPKLRDATDKQKQDWRFISNGIGIHWEEIDEDISVAGLLY